MAQRKNIFHIENIGDIKGVNGLMLRSPESSAEIAQSEADLRRAKVVWNYPGISRDDLEYPNENLYLQMAHAGKAYAPPWWIDAMKAQDVSAEQFKRWRTQMLCMSQRHAAAYFRVPIATITAWEKGRKMIPYAISFMMRWAMDCADVRLSKPGFDKWGVYYCSRDKVAKLYHRDIHIEFTEGHLIWLANEMTVLRMAARETDALRERVDQLIAENTKLREMFKSGEVTEQLRDMQARIDALLASIGTADIFAFKPKTFIDTKAAVLATLAQAAA